ncbi:hypothetical protein [Pseudarthrobacter oxydans]|uniref:hypothetical protein n=1 Tax=Pseudarthrobacter oxydans TaxID=1671 RepID=UPI0035E4A3BC|nr:hypothetical protein GCM10017547_38520 [Pseudarthrobacter oxydans]
MDFNPDTWGTVADWVGGLGTTAAFVAAVVVIAKDAKVRKLAQARKVAYTWEDTDTYSLATVAFHEEEDGPTPSIKRYTLSNLSDEPIYRAIFYHHGPHHVLQFLAQQAIILPGAKFSYESDEGQPPLVTFRDNSDVGWIRGLSGRIYSSSILGKNHRQIEQDLLKQEEKRGAVN